MSSPTRIPNSIPWYHISPSHLTVADGATSPAGRVPLQLHVSVRQRRPPGGIPQNSAALHQAAHGDSRNGGVGRRCSVGSAVDVFVRVAFAPAAAGTMAGVPTVSCSSSCRRRCQEREPRRRQGASGSVDHGSETMEGLCLRCLVSLLGGKGNGAGRTGTVRRRNSRERKQFCFDVRKIVYCQRVPCCVLIGSLIWCSYTLCALF